MTDITFVSSSCSMSSRKRTYSGESEEGTTRKAGRRTTQPTTAAAEELVQSHDYLTTAVEEVKKRHPATDGGNEKGYPRTEGTVF